MIPSKVEDLTVKKYRKSNFWPWTPPLALKLFMDGRLLSQCITYLRLSFYALKIDLVYLIKTSFSVIISRRPILNTAKIFNVLCNYHIIVIDLVYYCHICTNIGYMLKEVQSVSSHFLLIVKNIILRLMVGV